jgi:hypothetical protein
LAKNYKKKVAPMKTMCPISFNQANERAVQINAALAVLFMLLFLFTSYKWLIVILSIDFFVRGFLNTKYSFLNATSRTVVRICKIQPVMVNAGPKIFAAKVGFIFCCIIGLCDLLNYQSISLVIGCVFVFFALLEAVFKICIACKIYPFIYKIKTIN